ncbi:hypothetical protein [Actinomadura harenae]|uniref:hypothetical protein n=1 Tax=Actinomadura harenae TaxID=2483351 RepID=UPI0011C377F4|nr:hypothetical protein [Actinomadura harenae]
MADLATRDPEYLEALLSDLPERHALLLKDFYVTEGGRLSWTYLEIKHGIATGKLLEAVAEALQVAWEAGHHRMADGLLDIRRSHPPAAPSDEVSVCLYECCDRSMVAGIPVDGTYEVTVNGTVVPVHLQRVAQPGRPPKYCSNRCKQAAYRSRKARDAAAAARPFSDTP